AMVCAQKGYPLVVTMAETFSVERRRIMRFLGAKVVLTPATQPLGPVLKARELAKTHGWFMTRQFENEANADMHTHAPPPARSSPTLPMGGLTTGSLAMAPAARSKESRACWPKSARTLRSSCANR